MGLLDGKNIVITGVLTDASLAFGVAALAIDEGADVVLTGAGRALSLTERVARKLPKPVEVLELDVTVPEHLTNVRSALDEKWGRVDGVLHSIGFAPESCLGDDFMRARWNASPIRPFNTWSRLLDRFTLIKPISTHGVPPMRSSVENVHPCSLSSMRAVVHSTQSSLAFDNTPMSNAPPIDAISSRSASVSAAQSLVSTWIGML